MLQIHRGKNIQLAKIKKPEMQEVHDFLALFKEYLWINIFWSIKFKVVKKYKDKNAVFVPSECTKSAF